MISPLVHRSLLFVRRSWPKEDWLLLTTIGTLLFFTLLGWQTLPQQQNVPYGFFAGFPSALSDLTCWLPLSFKISQGNLFPISPGADPDSSGFSFYPYLSLWTHGLLIALMGVKKAEALAQIFFPIGAFLLIYSIFRRSISSLWSVSLTLLALISFSNLPFRNFLTEAVLGGTPSQVLLPQPLEILGFPFPSLSLFCFLLGFFLSTDPKPMTHKRAAFLTAFWALQSQVHPLNAITGLVFWFLTFPLRYRKAYPSLSLPRFTGHLCFNITLAVVICAPSLFAYTLMDQASGLTLSHLGLLANNHNALVNSLYYVAYFLVPIGVSSFIYFFGGIDPKEFQYRFWPVYALMLVEFLFNLGNIFSDVSFGHELYFSRLGLFFNHFYYYIPIIYFLTREPALFHSSKVPRRILYWWTTKASRVYLPLLCVALMAFAYFASVKKRSYNESVNTPGLERAWAERALLIQDLSEKFTLVSDNPTTNLLFPISSDHGSLWVNRFSNRITLEESLHRLALFARIFDWTEEQFLGFLSPGTLQRELTPTPLLLDRDHILSSGIGYWTVNHKLGPSNENTALLLQMAQRQYNELNIIEALKRYRVKRIFSSGGISKQIPIEKTLATPAGTVFEVKL